MLYPSVNCNLDGSGIVKIDNIKLTKCSSFLLLFQEDRSTGDCYQKLYGKFSLIHDSMYLIYLWRTTAYFVFILLFPLLLPFFKKKYFIIFGLQLRWRIWIFSRSWKFGSEKAAPIEVGCKRKNAEENSPVLYNTIVILLLQLLKRSWPIAFFLGFFCTVIFG